MARGRSSRRAGLAGLVLVVLFCTAEAEARLKAGNWMGSTGLGLMVSPAVFLLTTQLDYAYADNILIGPLVQAGLRNEGAIFGASFAARLMLGKHPRVRPNVEAGLGIAVSSSIFADSFGVLFHLGMGFDYLIQNNLAVGTIIRANFAPPMQTFFLSWPIGLLRFIF